MSEPRDNTARLLARGVGRLFKHLGFDSLTEFTLSSGRRVDVVGMNSKGKIAIAEIKISVADFRTDQKWREYMDFCDQFYFAAPLEFPVEILPKELGLILADAYGGEIIRPSKISSKPLHASRRRELTLRFARVAASRLRRWEDPPS